MMRRLRVICALMVAVSVSDAPRRGRLYSRTRSFALTLTSTSYLDRHWQLQPAVEKPFSRSDWRLRVLVPQPLAGALRP